MHTSRVSIVQQRHGMSFPYSGNVSWHTMNHSMDQEIRQKYTKKPTPLIVINWVFLVLAFWMTFFGFLLWFVMLALSARPSKIAGMPSFSTSSLVPVILVLEALLCICLAGWLIVTNRASLTWPVRC